MFLMDIYLLNALVLGAINRSYKVMHKPKIAAVLHSNVRNVMRKVTPHYVASATYVVVVTCID